eukprot:scaffold37353_cov26-Cyclotella_meneghiniana.AAC.1
MHVYPYYPLPGKTLYPRVLSIRLYPVVTASFTGSSELVLLCSSRAHGWQMLCFRVARAGVAATLAIRSGGGCNGWVVTEDERRRWRPWFKR